MLAAITADNRGRHDLLLGGAVTRGPAHNTLDNLLPAAGKHGLDRRDIAPCLTLFADVWVGADGTFGWHGSSAPGSTADLRAEMDLPIVLSICPQLDNPCNGFNPTPTRVAWVPP